MISVNRTKIGSRRIEIEGTNLEILADLLAAIDTVTKTAFKDSDQDRIEFVKDIPCLVLGARPTMVTIDLEKLGGK